MINIFKKIELILASFFFGDLLLEIKNHWFDEGKKQGYILGKEDGYESGFEAGKETGYLNGFNNGSKDGVYLNQYGMFISKNKNGYTPVMNKA